MEQGGHGHHDPGRLLPHPGYQFQPPVFSPTTSQFTNFLRSYIHKQGLIHSTRPPVFQAFCDLDPSQQFEEWMTSIPLTFEEIQSRHAVLGELHEILTRFYPQGVLHPFGSFLTGLGDYGSDLDIYFDAGGGGGHSGQGQGSWFKVNPKNALNKCTQLLRQSKRFREITPITKAKVPIVKFIHGESGISGDISFDNTIAVRNSDLLKLYCDLHPVVKPLCVLVKYWAKYHGLSGPSLIKNYTFVLLTLVYLAKRGIVPNVEQLKVLERQRRGQGLSEEFSVNGWDTGFSTNIPEIRHNFLSSLDAEEFVWNFGSRFSTILELFEGFCNFYAHLDFSTHLICTLTADTLPKSLFHPDNPHIPPRVLNELKIWTELCVQDPFVLNFNVSLPTNAFTVVSFQSACCQTSQKIRSLEGIQSFFDLFFPIPEALRNADCVKWGLRYLKELEVKKEIKEVMGFFPSRNSVPPPDWDGVPLHLMTRPQLDDFGKNYGDTATYLHFANSFKTLFSKEVVNQQRKSDPDMKHFWIEYVQDFLKYFWALGFGLNVEMETFVRNVMEKDLSAPEQPPAKRRKTENLEEKTKAKDDVYLKLTCSGTLPALSEMSPIIGNVMRRLNWKLKKDSKSDGSTSEEVNKGNPLNVLSTIVAATVEKTDASFRIYVKLAMTSTHDSQIRPWPLAIVISDELDNTKDMSATTAALLPHMMEIMFAIFPKYLSYRAKEYSADKLTSRINSTNPVPVKRDNKPQKKTETETTQIIRIATPAGSPLAQNNSIVLGLEDEDPKMKRLSESVKVSTVQKVVKLESPSPNIPIITLD